MFRSTALLSLAHLGDLEVLCRRLTEDALVGEAGQSGADVVLLAHLKVLAEVLVTAPPVQVDHAESLIPANLMEVSIPDVVLDTIGWESSVTVKIAMGLVVLTDSESPVLDHPLFLILDHDVEEEGGPEVEDNHAPHETNAILSVEGLRLPVEVADWVLEEAGDVFERSPSLRVISWLLRIVDELEEVSISVLSQGSTDHVSTLVDVGHTIHETFDTSEALAHG